MSINCVVCGTNFDGRRDAKTCSVSCRKRLQRLKAQFNRSNSAVTSAPASIMASDLQPGTPQLMAALQPPLPTAKHDLLIPRDKDDPERSNKENKHLWLIGLIVLATAALIIFIVKVVTYTAQLNNWQGG